MNPSVFGAPVATPAPAQMTAAWAGTFTAPSPEQPEGSFADLLMAVEADIEPAPGQPALVEPAQPWFTDIQELVLTESVDLAQPETAERDLGVPADVTRTDTAALAYALVEALPAPAFEVNIAFEPVMLQPIVAAPLGQSSSTVPTVHKDSALIENIVADEEANEEVELTPSATVTEAHALPSMVPVAHALNPAPAAAEVQPQHTGIARGDASPAQVPTGLMSSQPASQAAERSDADIARIGSSNATPAELAAKGPVVLEAHITAKEQKTLAPDQPSNDINEIISEPHGATASIKEVRHTASSGDDAERDESPSWSAQPDAPAKAPSGPAPALAVPESVASNELKAPVAEASKRPLVMTEPPEPAPAPRTPLKQMDVRIPDVNGDGKGDVMVRIQERAGAVQVSVRSNDSQIASNLAQGLPDLTRALDQQGFKAETWTPRDANVLAALGEGSKILQAETPQQSQSHNEQQQKQSHRNPDGQEEPKRRPRRQPEEDFKEQL